MQENNIINKILSSEVPEYGNDISDIFLFSNETIKYKKGGEGVIEASYDNTLTNDDIFDFFDINKDDFFENIRDLDTSTSKYGYRFRVNIFTRQKKDGTNKPDVCSVMRILPSHVPEFENLGVPDNLLEMTRRKQGLILVTGATNSGKSTTVASLVDYILRTRPVNVITIEDPVELIFESEDYRGIVSQRDITVPHTANFQRGLKAALRESPEVIYVGEIRDKETATVLMTAANSGHLCISTIHSASVKETVQKFIAMYPPEMEKNIRFSFSQSFACILSQHLVSTPDKSGRTLLYEYMISSQGTRTLIKDSKEHQLDNEMMKPPMVTLKKRGIELVSKKKADKESVTAVFESVGINK